MGNLSLARVTMLHALRLDDRLIVYVEGLTSGYGGRLIVERRPERVLPPLFHVHEEPGNPGINPSASPQDVPTVAACFFDAEGVPESITVESVGQSQEIPIVEVEAGATTSPPGTQDGGGDNGGGQAGSMAGDGGGGSGGAGDCNWTAIHDFMPPGPARLRVTGTCTMPTPGYKLTLTKANPQGFNPQILLLDLKTEAPTGIVPQVLTPTPASYEEETDFKYTQVTIQPSGATVDVQDVH